MIYFDWIYYINKYGDLRNAGINNHTDALNHWINYGLKEHRICNKLFEKFNWNEYLNKHPQLKTKNDALFSYYKEINNIQTIITKPKSKNTILLDKIKQLNLNNKHFNIKLELNLSNIKINTSLSLYPVNNIISSTTIKQNTYLKYSSNNDVKIIICSCVYKRFELSKFCISEWLKLDVYKIIIAYSFDEDYDNLESLKELDINSKLILVKYPNLPLSNKWNHSVYTAKQYNPDAIMIMGSDDILTNSYLTKVKYYINRNVDYISNNNWANLWYFSNKIMISTERYISRCTNDGLGSGRVINARLLNIINWNLYKFDKPINKCLDSNSYNKISQYITTKVFDIDGFSILLLKLSGDNTAITVKDNLTGYIEKVYRTNNFNKTVDNVYYMDYN